MSHFVITKTVLFVDGEHKTRRRAYDLNNFKQTCDSNSSRRAKIVTTTVPITEGGSGKKKRAGISEKAFVKAVRELYPNVLFHKLDEKDFDDVWIRGIGYWEAERVLYSRSDKNIRMWRNFGAYDYNFKNLDDFKVWLKNAYADNRKFEETPEATK